MVGGGATGGNGGVGVVQSGSTGGMALSLSLTAHDMVYMAALLTVVLILGLHMAALLTVVLILGRALDLRVPRVE